MLRRVDLLTMQNSTRLREYSNSFSKWKFRGGGGRGEEQKRAQSPTFETFLSTFFKQFLKYGQITLLSFKIQRSYLFGMNISKIKLSRKKIQALRNLKEAH